MRLENSGAAGLPASCRSCLFITVLVPPLILHPMNPRQKIQAEELQVLTCTVRINLKAKARRLPEKELEH